MKARAIAFYSIFFFALYLLTELLLRIGLLVYGYPFLNPSAYIYKGFYKEMDGVVEQDIRKDEVKDILILGGSVVSPAWSHMELRLDSLLTAYYKGKKKIKVHNLATAGHTSRDNSIKYSLLDRQRFDLVIYYEAINENRANNIPDKDFRSDYTHFKWYQKIAILRNHPEINFTVIPYVADLVIHALDDLFKHKIYISEETVTEGYAVYGAKIKSAGSFKKNLQAIIGTSQSRGDKLLLLSYASFFPHNVKLTGQESDMRHFAGCRFASPVTIWGQAENVNKGIAEHNKILRQLVKQYNLSYFDMAASMPADSAMFCDVCHVSEKGAKHFAKELAGFIEQSKILE